MSSVTDLNHGTVRKNGHLLKCVYIACIRRAELGRGGKDAYENDSLLFISAQLAPAKFCLAYSRWALKKFPHERGLKCAPVYIW